MAKTANCVTDPIPLMAKYLDGNQGELTNDEREILLFALYCESRENPEGIANCGIRRLKAGAAACEHYRLNEDGICRSCGTDRRGV